MPNGMVFHSAVSLSFDFRL